MKFPKRVEPYELFQRVGHGSFGDVYRGKNTLASEIVAIKMLRGVGLASNYINKEIKNLKALNHENIIKLYSVKTTLNHTYIMI